jgi:hypothetical protein
LSLKLAGLYQQLWIVLGTNQSRWLVLGDLYSRPNPTSPTYNVQCIMLNFNHLLNVESFILGLNMLTIQKSHNNFFIYPSPIK